jgi:hypothetical protein
MTKRERGVVIGSYHRLEHERFEAWQGNPDGRYRLYSWHPQLVDAAIRRSILYFDYADWPTTNTDRPVLQGVEVLEAQGFLRRSQITVSTESPLNPAEAEAAASRFVFEQLEVEQPGAWVFAHIVAEAPHWGPKLEPTQADLVTRRGIEFELYNVLPVPAPSVSFAEILDFKDRKMTQLMALRRYMDNLYDGIVTAGDVPHRKNAALSELDDSLSELTAAMRASRFRAVWQSLRVHLLFDVVSGAVLGARAAEAIQQPAQYGAAVGAGLGVYKFTRKEIPSPITRSGPLAYLASAAAERIVAV